MSKRLSGVMAYLALLAITAASPWPATLLAESEIQRDPELVYLGHPVVHTEPADYQLALSPEQLKASYQQEKERSKFPGNAAGNSTLESGQRFTTEATVGTWFQGGHTGAWYNRAQDGHGLFIEIIPDSGASTGVQVFAAWYTFLDGRQVWLVGQGPVIQESNRHRADLDAYIFEGGDFPPFFNPNQISQQYWGEMTLQFNGCSNAELTWTSTYPGFTSGSLALERLTSIHGATCNPDLGGSSGGPQDDHGNDRTSRSAFSGNRRTGRIDFAGDVDAFGWRSSCSGAASGMRTRVWTTGSMDTLGELRRTNNYNNPNSGEQVIAADDDGGEGLNFLIDVELPCDGDYTIYVTGYANSTGDYTVWYETSTPQQTTTMRVDFENRLLKDIQVFKNGISLGVVPANEIRGDSYAIAAGDQFSFQTIQDFGDHMEGIYPPISNLNQSQINYLANNIIGDSWFFIPYITNNTSQGRLLGVNMELQAENRCNCVIPANTPNVVAGYYRLYSNSNLRLYQTGSNYTGQYNYWENFSSAAQANTGRINFSLN